MAAPFRALRLVASKSSRTLQRIECIASSQKRPSPAQQLLPAAAHRRSNHVSPRSHRSSSLHTTALRGRSVGHNNEQVPESAPTTDFGRMDMLGQTPVPSTSVDICMHDGFQLNSGVVIDGGDGALLVGGEAFVWRPWREGKRMLNAKGQWEVDEAALGVLGLVWPRPDLLILGMGREIRPLSPATKRLISSLGIRVDILDTRNAASQFNLLATERGVHDVAAALMPMGWKEGVGCV
ncbi:hypothetical protein B0T22DRAFT_369392 [Podospora appendiculata]|uniref:NADH dehydrogenase [ubiquinone] 1 alpha subcomplex assembly factor 3 n=1 Tax=Podospora appendiculata TaxID=314037 RepID=A0AAE1CF49_9PEZI|nr:hypothetical protein B0T22DRAFT_369392 [Podospora appendiculata]